MQYSADPLDGWPLKEVEECSNRPATADIYGKLFYHIRGVLRAFLLRLSGSKLDFRLLRMDASQLPSYLDRGSFTRIEVRNRRVQSSAPVQNATPY